MENHGIVFFGGTTFLDTISFRPSNTGDLARRDHITFYCHQVRQLRASIPCVIFARLWFCSCIASFPVAICGNLLHTNGTLEDNHWKTGQPLKNGKQRKAGKPLDTTGNQRWKPPSSIMARQETWPLREEKEVTDATEAIICCVADWCWSLQNGGGIHITHTMVKHQQIALTKKRWDYVKYHDEKEHGIPCEVVPCGIQSYQILPLSTADEMQFSKVMRCSWHCAWSMTSMKICKNCWCGVKPCPKFPLVEGSPNSNQWGDDRNIYKDYTKPAPPNFQKFSPKGAYFRWKAESVREGLMYPLVI